MPGLQLANRLLALMVAGGVSCFAPLSHGSELLAGKSVPLKAEQIRFSFEAQDGSFSLPCHHSIANQATQDWLVTCGENGKAASERRYTVHLWLKSYAKPAPPKLSYEVLYWATDHQIDPGKSGRYVGSTIWFRLEEPSSLHSLDLGQDIENIASLRLQVRLKN